MILYTTKNCSQCRIAKKILEEKGIDYQTIDVETAEGLVEFSLVVDHCNGSQKMPAMLVFDRVVAQDITKYKLLQGDEVIKYLNRE